MTKTQNTQPPAEDKNRGIVFSPNHTSKGNHIVKAKKRQFEKPDTKRMMGDLESKLDAMKKRLDATDKKDTPQLNHGHVVFHNDACKLSTTERQVMGKLLKRPDWLIHSGDLDANWKPGTLASVVSRLRSKLRSAGMSEIASAIVGVDGGYRYLQIDATLQKVVTSCNVQPVELQHDKVKPNAAAEAIQVRVTALMQQTGCLEHQAFCRVMRQHPDLRKTLVKETNNG